MEHEEHSREEEAELEAYRRNISLYPLYSFFLGMLIIGPVLTPYLLLKGLDYVQIMVLQSISAATVVFFEVPTGMVADRVSRRLSLVLAGAGMSGGLVLYILGQTFFWLALAEFVFALGLTCRSGAAAALLYESLKKLGRQAEFARIDGRANSYVFVGQAAGTLLSSVLYTYDPDLPFWVGVASAAVAAGLAFFFSPTGDASTPVRYRTHVFDSVRQIYRSKALLWIGALAALMGVAARTGFWLYEPYFTAVDIDVVFFGGIFFVYNLVAAGAAKYLTRSGGGERRTLLGLGLLLGLSFLLPALFFSRLSVAFIGLQQIVRGLYKPTLGAYINVQVTEDRYRATVLSLAGLATSLCFALFSPLVGFSLDRWGAVPTYACMGSATLAGVCLLACWRTEKKQPPGE